MKELIQRSLDLLRSDKDIREQSDGMLVTGFSDQLGFLCELQLSVAKDILPQRYLERVLAVCNKELLDMVSELMLQVETNWGELARVVFALLSMTHQFFRNSAKIEIISFSRVQRTWKLAKI